MNTDLLFGFRLMRRGEPKAPVLEPKLGDGKGLAFSSKAPPNKPTTGAAPAVLQPKLGVLKGV